jgi:RNA polymerase sigma-70 factor (ECF subfamily)
MYAELTDADLARRIACATPASAIREEEELCRRYTRRVYLYGLRHLCSEDRARDLAQDVMVVTLEKLRNGKLRDPDRVGSFILGVARMISRAAGRAAAREENVDEIEDSSASVDSSPPDPLLREKIVRCLEALKERQRTVVVLTYYAEQSTGAIASTLGLSENNVRVIRHRGIEGLRSCLGFGHHGVVA